MATVMVNKKEERKYYVKSGWVFNLEAMHDKIWSLIYDIREGKLECPFQVAGREIKEEADLFDLQEEAENLEWIAKSRKVTSKEYGEIKKLVEWRVMQRYNACLASGMDEKMAGGCFDDL